MQKSTQHFVVLSLGIGLIVAFDIGTGLPIQASGDTADALRLLLKSPEGSGSVTVTNIGLNMGFVDTCSGHAETAFPTDAAAGNDSNIRFHGGGENEGHVQKTDWGVLYAERHVDLKEECVELLTGMMVGYWNDFGNGQVREMVRGLATQRLRGSG